jgi:hypothetical protein
MSTAASIALILMLVPTILCTLPILAITFAMVFGMHKLRGGVKQVMPRAQHATERMVQITRQVCDKAAEPFIAAQARSASMRTNISSARRYAREKYAGFKTRWSA